MDQADVHNQSSTEFCSSTLQTAIPQNKYLSQILQAREERAAIQRMLLKQQGTAVITFTMNIPGPEKNAWWISRCFEDGINNLYSVLRGMQIECMRIRTTAAGPEAFFRIPAGIDPLEVKKCTVLYEQTYPVGRWFDIDVIRQDGRPITRAEAGFGERQCFLCHEDAKVCGRSRRHTADELYAYTKKTITAFLERKNPCLTA